MDQTWLTNAISDWKKAAGLAFGFFLLLIGGLFFVFDGAFGGHGEFGHAVSGESLSDKDPVGKSAVLLNTIGSTALYSEETPILALQRRYLEAYVDAINMERYDIIEDYLEAGRARNPQATVALDKWTDVRVIGYAPYSQTERGYKYCQMRVRVTKGRYAGERGYIPCHSVRVFE